MRIILFRSTQLKFGVNPSAGKFESLWSEKTFFAKLITQKKFLIVKIVHSERQREVSSVTVSLALTGLNGSV